MKNDDFERITNNKLFTHAIEAVEYQKKTFIKVEIANYISMLMLYHRNDHFL